MGIIDWQIMYNGLNDKIDKGIVLYGASGSGKKIAMLLQDLDMIDKVLAVVDSDERKWGKYLSQYKICNPQIIKTFSNDVIVVIASIYLDEIYQYLQDELQCYQEVCSSFSFRQALHFDIMNNKSFYISDKIIKEYKKRYSLWKKETILRNFITQQQHFYGMIRCIMENTKSILLLAMPKTGNISLQTSLDEEKKSDVVMTRHASYFDSYSLKMLREILKCFDKHEIKILCGIREPVERIISQKWQEISHPYKQSDSIISILLDENYHTFITDLVSHEKISGDKFDCGVCFYADSADWFKDHIEKSFGINIFNYPFDKQKGYTIINKNNISIFIYRLDKLSQLENEISKFVGDNSFRLKKKNVASEKRYVFVYRKYLKKVKIKKSFFDILVESKGMTHFYTKEECRKYKDKWKSKLI